MVRLAVLAALLRSSSSPWLLLAAASCAVGCSGGDDPSTGVCTGMGWRDTCHYDLTCSGGRFELVCAETNDPEINTALEAAGIVLDGTVCACVVDEAHAEAIDHDGSFCADQFSDDDPGRFDAAAAIVGELCGWDVR